MFAEIFSSFLLQYWRQKASECIHTCMYVVYVCIHAHYPDIMLILGLCVRTLAFCNNNYVIWSVTVLYSIHLKEIECVKREFSGGRNSGCHSYSYYHYKSKTINYSLS